MSVELRLFCRRFQQLDLLYRVLATKTSASTSASASASASRLEETVGAAVGGDV